MVGWMKKWVFIKREQLALIQAVLFSILIYLLSILKLPKKVATILNMLMEFFCGKVTVEREPFG